MNHSTLGPPTETFGPNLKIVSILVVIGLLFCGLAFAVAREIQDQTAWIVFEALAAGFAAVIIGCLASRAWLHDNGISYRNILGHGEVRWEEIQWIYFGTADLHAHWIPLGKLERFKLITNEQKTIRFGGNIRNAGRLHEIASRKTFERLYRKAVEEFDSGVELKFGAIRVEPSSGIVVHKWLLPWAIHWREIAGFEVDDYFFSVDRNATPFAIRISAERIANAAVLHALLTGVMKTFW